MSYSQMAQLELLNALNNISSEAELNEFKDLVAHFFAQKAQKGIDALWMKELSTQIPSNNGAQEREMGIGRKG